jgi:hypothetical protein
MNKNLYSRYFFALAILVAGVPLRAQVNIDMPGLGISIKTDSSTGQGKGSASVVASDVEMEGIAVINGGVYIDGEKIPAGVTRYVSKKNGKTYLIKRDRDGNVSVTQK